MFAHTHSFRCIVCSSLSVSSCNTLMFSFVCYVSQKWVENFGISIVENIKLRVKLREKPSQLCGRFNWKIKQKRERESERNKRETAPSEEYSSEFYCFVILSIFHIVQISRTKNNELKGTLNNVNGEYIENIETVHLERARRFESRYYMANACGLLHTSQVLYMWFSACVLCSVCVVSHLTRNVTLFAMHVMIMVLSVSCLHPKINPPRSSLPIFNSESFRASSSKQKKKLLRISPSNW